MPLDRRIVPAGAAICAAAAILLLTAARPAAHDIPASVTVQAFLRPAGQRLHLIVRAPLGSMRDINFPRHGPGFLDLDRLEPSLRDAAAMWIGSAIAVYEDDARLPKPQIVAARVSLQSDRSFGTYDEALAHVTGAPLAAGTELMWDQALLDVLLEYPIRSDASKFSIEPMFARLGIRVVTALRFVPPGGAVRAFEFTGDPGLVRLDPSWRQAVLRFVALGFFHILDGVDHLLFLFCLVIPFRRVKQLILVVTSFTVAHSITLIASAFNLAPDAQWFPPLIETLIAMSIVYMALENIVGVTSISRRWIITFGFGLVHGFGFSFALRETLQFAGSHLLTSLLAFNVGVELGQILVLLILVPALAVLFRYVLAEQTERTGTIILSALIAHTAWHWMTDRAEILRQFAWPTVDAALMASVLRWLMVVVVAAGVIWLVTALRQPQTRKTGDEGVLR